MKRVQISNIRSEAFLTKDKSLGKCRGLPGSVVAWVPFPAKELPKKMKKRCSYIHEWKEQ